MRVLQKMQFLSALLTAVCISIAGSANAQMQLLMAEEVGCMWCERWNSQVAPIYPKSAEGKIAPLTRIDINAPLPDNLDISRPLHYTPTFILIEDGKEIGRIEGYPGEDFFWGLLGQMIANAQKSHINGQLMLPHQQDQNGDPKIQFRIGLTMISIDDNNNRFGKM
jgi:hypothetical protein